MCTSNGNPPISAHLDWVPAACSLPTVEQPVRVAEFDDLFGTSVRAAHRVDSTTLRLTLAADAEARAVELAGRESNCCSFFGFDFVPDDGAVAMTVTVPTAHVAVMDTFEARAAAAAGLATRSAAG